MKYLILFLLIFSNAMASSTHNGEDHKHKKEQHSTQLAVTKDGNKLKIKINGMVCSFCAQGIEKSFKKEKSVKTITVNMDSKIVSIELLPGKTLKREKIVEIVESSGFSVQEIKKEANNG